MLFLCFFELIFLVGRVLSRGACFCGYGTTCRFTPYVHDPVPTDCTKCGIVSKGLYRDCHELYDHCGSYPCMNGGTCVMTYGGFFCRCQPEYYGHTCQHKRKKSETLDVVSSPRVWYQMNRVWGGVTRENQLIHFAVEEPGDDMKVQVRFGDGRILSFSDTELKVTNEKQKCLEDVEKYPLPSDPEVCETLPDRELHSTTIEVAFYDDKFATSAFDQVEVEIGGKNVSSGRYDDIHITVLNWQKITYSAFYRVTTAFDIWPKCSYKINFFGCSVSSDNPTVHEGEHLIYLESIRIPVSKCEGIAVVKKMDWYMTERVKYPFASSTSKEDVYLDAKELSLGKHYIDFLMVVEGRPPYHGIPALSYNYGRCWIKIVKGGLKVGIEGGDSKAVPCINPLSFRIFSYNSNYAESNFASIWRCNNKELELCERQRFLGPNVFFRPPPCGIVIEFRAMVVDVLTGSKTFLTATVQTSIHIDQMHCRCTYNCYPSINPLSAVAMGVEQFRYSVNRDRTHRHVKWEATFAGEAWGIERFIVPETYSARIEIPPFTFMNLTDIQSYNNDLWIKASIRNLYCTIALKVSIPLPPPYVGVSNARHYVDTVNDKRFKITVLDHGVINDDLPVSYVLSEAITPNSSEKEVVAFKLADDQQFSIAKMEVPTYITTVNFLGQGSPERMISPINVSPRVLDENGIRSTIELIKNLASIGNDNDALTEMVYVSRSIASSDSPMYGHKTRIMKIMNEVTGGMDSSASNLVVSAKLNTVLITINRLMLISNLTEPPFNVSIDPWKAPSMPSEFRAVRAWVSTFSRSANTIHSVTSYYYQHVLKRLNTPNDATILQLMFQAILRIQLAWSWKGYAVTVLRQDPILLFRMKAEAKQMLLDMQKAIEMLMKSIDFHIDSYTGHMNITCGTSSASGTVFLAYDDGRLAGRVYNEMNNVKVSVELQDSSLLDSDAVYFGVFVEIPLVDDFTTRVHVFLLTHLTQRNLNGTIDVMMNVSGYREICDPEQCLGATISRSSRQMSVDVFKMELGSVEDVLGAHSDREVKIYLTSNTSLKAVLSKSVPLYNDVAKAPPTKDTELAEVVGYNDAFLGILPASNAPGIPINLLIDTMQFVCVQRVFEDPTLITSKESRTLCNIVPTAVRDTKSITCRCHESGLIETLGVTVKLTKVLQDSEAIPYTPRDTFWTIENRLYNYLILIFPVLLILLMIFVFWRDKTCIKREQIQVFADTMPGDEFPYVICVCTGQRIMSGTRANVAIQIYGSISASRVHLLKSRSYKVLGRGQEDWFVIYTPERLGKLNHLTLWQDYSKCCSDWYCKQVLLYDVEYQVWFQFIIDKWITVSANADRSRMTIVRSRKYIPEKEIGESFSFQRHYWRELKNTHSLLSPFTKHRRFVQTFVMRGALMSAIILLMISLVILMDSFAKQRNLEVRLDNIMAITIIAVLVASIPFTFASSLFTRSLLKMKRTKTLDLNWVDQMKRKWVNEIPESEHWTKRQTIAFSLHQIPIITETAEHNEKKSVNSTEEGTSTSPTKRPGSKKGIGVQLSNVQYPYLLRSHKWLASSIYRPITAQKYEYRIKWGYYVSAWIVVLTTILVCGGFIISWTLIHGWLGARNGLLIATVAIGIESIRCALVVLFFSCHAIYAQKRCNFEIFCLDLTGLQNDAKITNHLKFIEDTTKPYYHPLRADVVKAMHLRKKKRETILKTFSFCSIIILLLIVAFSTPWFRDTPNIYRIMKSTKEAYREPIVNQFTDNLNLLEEVHTLQEVSNYLLATVIPVSFVYKWYNDRPLQVQTVTKEKINYFWFVDRSSWAYNPMKFRFLQVDNDGVQYTALQFRNLSDINYEFENARGHFNYFSKYKTIYNRWQVLIRKTESDVYWDTILLRGIYGVTGMFYPSSIGEEVTPSWEKKPQHTAEIILKLKKFVTNQTRAMIASINIAHPSISPKRNHPQVGFTILHILVENCATGLYTGSIKAEFFRANVSKNYMHVAILYTAMTVVCAAALIIWLSMDGLKAGSKRMHNIVLFFGTIVCFVCASSHIYIHHYVSLHEMHCLKQECHQIDYHNIVWLMNQSDAACGCFLLLLSISGAIWWAELSGLSSGKIRSFLILAVVYSIFLFISFCIGVLLNEGSFRNAFKVEFIAKYSRITFLTDPTRYIYVVISRCFFWPTQIGVVIFITSSYLNMLHIHTIKINYAQIKNINKKKRPQKTEDASNSDLQRRSTSALLESTSLQMEELPSGSEDPTARLEKKFDLWK